MVEVVVIPDDVERLCCRGRGVGRSPSEYACGPPDASALFLLGGGVWLDGVDALEASPASSSMLQRLFWSPWLFIRRRCNLCGRIWVYYEFHPVATLAAEPNVELSKHFLFNYCALSLSIVYNDVTNKKIYNTKFNWFSRLTPLSINEHLNILLNHLMVSDCVRFSSIFWFLRTRSEGNS